MAEVGASAQAAAQMVEAGHLACVQHHFNAESTGLLVHAGSPGGGVFQGFGWLLIKPISYLQQNGRTKATSMGGYLRAVFSERHGLVGD
jgi:hypothetical protein